MKDYSIRTKPNFFVFGIFLLCLSFVALLANSTLAWFKDESITSNGNAEILLVGTLSLDVYTNFNFYNLALAPDRVYLEDYVGSDIGTYVKTSSNHDIHGAYVRIKFQTTRKNVGEENWIDNSDLLSLYFDEDSITTATSYADLDAPAWYYNEADDYYYYIGAVEGTNIVFNSGYKTSNKMTNTVKDADVRMIFTVEAIQRQYDAYADVWQTTAPDIFKEWAIADKEDRWGQQE